MTFVYELSLHTYFSTLKSTHFNKSVKEIYIYRSILNSKTIIYCHFTFNKYTNKRNTNVYTIYHPLLTTTSHINFGIGKASYDVL